ncbi:MAG: hypothetical protein QW051_00635 [Candidatus Aenigmatarchaeota archaeon]
MDIQHEQEEYEVLLLKKMIKYSTATFISVLILLAILLGKYFSTKELTRFYDTLLVFQTVITLLSAFGQIIAINKLLKRKR